MNAIPKISAAPVGPESQQPIASDPIGPRSTGARRSFDKVKALPLKWPPDKRERFKLFDAWHDVSMQLLHRAGASFRLMAVMKIVINWQTGTITNSNDDLALHAGCCSRETIKRELRDYTSLGILISAKEWKRPEGRKFITVRTLHPALPMELPAGIILPENVDLSRVNSGPDLDAVRRVNSGPTGRVNSGPSTIEDHKGREH